MVTSLVKDVFTPFIGRPGGQAGLQRNCKLGSVMIGNFLNAVVSFLMVAAAVYFFIVLPANALLARFKKPDAPPPAPETKICPECLSDIPTAAKRCALLRPARRLDPATAAPAKTA